MTVAETMWKRLRVLAERRGTASAPDRYLDPRGDEARLESAVRAGVREVGGWREVQRNGAGSRARFLQGFDAEIERMRANPMPPEPVRLFGDEPESRRGPG